MQQPNYNLWHTNASSERDDLASLNVPLAHASSVCVGETVYVGGGNEPLCPFIYRYNALEKKWLQLPNTPKANNLTAFALCEVNKSLVAVGGWNTDNGTPSSSLFSYLPEEEKWKEGLTPFSTPRACPSAASNSNYIIVYGGLSNAKNKSSTINSLEIYSIQTGQWSTYEHDRLPFENQDFLVNSVLTANNKLLLANCKEVFWIRLNELIGNDMQSSTIVTGTLCFANRKSQSVPENLPCQSQPCKEEQPASRSASGPCNREPQENAMLVVPKPIKSPWIDVQLPTQASSKTSPCFTLFGEQIAALWNGKLYILNTSTNSWGDGDNLEYLQGCTAVELSTQAKLLLIGGYSRDNSTEKSDKVSQVSFLA